MKKQHTILISRALPRTLQVSLIATLLLALISLLDVQSCRAQSATWNESPNSGDWDDASNWTPAVVPTDTATFGDSFIEDISFSFGTEVRNIVFTSGVSAFTITAPGGATLLSAVPALRTILV